MFDQSRGVNQPKARFSYLFPTKDSALIQVRLRADLSDAQTAQAISWIRQAVRMKMFRLGFGGHYTVSGEPVVVNDLASTITSSVALLLLGAVAVMAAVLLVVFRGRLRLLPLILALVAAAVTFGATSLAGATLTMASIAVLPILIGLSVDYAIQFQSRTREAQRAGAASAEAAVTQHRGADDRRGGAGHRHRLPGAAALAGPHGAGIRCAAGGGGRSRAGRRPDRRVGGDRPGRPDAQPDTGAVMARRLRARSRRDRAKLVLAEDRRGENILGDAGRTLARALASPFRRATAFGRGQGSAAPRRSPASRTLSALTTHPGRVLLVGFVLALAGWVTDTQTGVQSDVTKLVPSNMPALRHLDTLERVTGVSGELDVLVHARNVATPRTVEWMISYENRLLSHFGYSEAKGCQAATVCPALSLPDLFSSASGSDAGSSSGTALTSASIQGLLAAVPQYFSQAVLTRDHRYATLAFGIRLMPLARQTRVIDYMRSQLHPPSGVSARVAGLPVLAADANSALSSSARRLLTLLAALVAVGLVLFAVFRSPRRALVPLVPIVLATGWSALIVFAIGIPLNPMSATLGALVIAISTEFSVLLAERFGQERAAAVSDGQALERAYRSTGVAVLASGITAIAGFGVLVLSNITMLRDFGFVTLIDMTVSLAGVLLVLPAVLTLADRNPSDLAELVRDRLARVGTISLRRRRARVA